MNLAELFALNVSPLELMLRGTLMYWLLLLLFRFVLPREAGSLGIADVLLVVLVADAAQNAMAGEHKSIAEGVVLVGTLVAWNVAIDWAGFHWPAVRRLLQSPPLLLIADGRVIARNLRREYITMDDLASELRQQGLENPSQVRRGWLEGDGNFSFLRFDDKGGGDGASGGKPGGNKRTKMPGG